MASVITALSVSLVNASHKIGIAGAAILFGGGGFDLHRFEIDHAICFEIDLDFWSVLSANFL